MPNYIYIYIYIKYMTCKQKVCRKHYFKMSQSSFVCAQLNGSKYREWLNISI